MSPPSPIPDCVTALYGQVDKDQEDDIHFYIQQHGLAGEFRLFTTTTDSDHIPPSPTNLPLGLGEQYLLPHDLRKEIELEFLTPPKTFPKSLLPHVQYCSPTPTDLQEQYVIDLAPSSFSISFERDFDTGAPGNWHYSSTKESLNATNSTSLHRDPLTTSTSKDYLSGKSSNLPFTPGGLPAPTHSSAVTDVTFGTQLLHVPPGLTRGMLCADMEPECIDLANSFANLFKPSTENIDAVDTQLLEHLLTQDSDDDSINSAPQSTTDSEILDPKSDLANPEVDTLLDAKIQDLQILPKPAPISEYAKVVTDPMHDFHDRVPELAHKYSFELDTFQKQAIYHLEQGKSVFVAAHTSAGKTVIAEYAISLAQLHMTRAIYTSPIKALSNQKYRDFSLTYGEKAIGIITGDVQIHPEAGCLIMTTEILRSMLYKGADLIRDLEFVIVDEAHYLSDASRGVVWEEVIIMLPSHIQLILLSATVPNVLEFADWIGRTKKKEIFVISTTHRPVPLEHYLYVPSAKEYFKFVDAQRTYLPDGIKKAHQHILGLGNKSQEQLKLEKQAFQQQQQQQQSRGRGSRGGRGSAAYNSFAPKRNLQQKLDKTTWSSLVGILTKKDLLPVTVFVFSRKFCEEYAECLFGKDLLTAAEKSDVHVFIERAVLKLRPEDRKLPQIERMRHMMMRGIAVHHSGLLPLVKELVEILFARGIIKVLFATETFAMGVNMPTKCVVFAHVRKHDGTQFRDLLPGEYTQMSGRAGRRGLDSTGMVLIMCVDEPQTMGLHEMVLGTPKKLASQFRLTYNMILNLLRVETIKVEEMMKRSFSENAVQKMLPSAELEFIQVQRELDAIKPHGCLICSIDLHGLYEACTSVLEMSRAMHMIIVGHPVGAKALCTGRIVVVASARYQLVIGVILSKQRSTTSNAAGVLLSVFVLTDVVEKYPNLPMQGLPIVLPLPLMNVQVPEEGKTVGHTIKVQPTDICVITPDTIPNIPNQLNTGYHSSALIRQLREYVQSRNGCMVEHDWKKIGDLDFCELMIKKTETMARLSTFKAGNCPDLNEHYAHFHHERHLQTQLLGIRKQLTSENLELLPEYHQRIAVLDNLGFIDPRTRTVQLKGRVACEINTCDELILTELILNNLFADLDVPETVAVLSTLVFHEKSEFDVQMSRALEEHSSNPNDLVYAEENVLNRFTNRLVKAIRQLLDTVQDLGSLQMEFGIGVDNDAKVKFGMVQVAYEWAQGVPFCQIMGLTSIHEGSIVRCIHRLADTCREVKDAARLIGDGDLYVKMDAAEACIKRDIVFTGSLYI